MRLSTKQVLFSLSATLIICQFSCINGREKNDFISREEAIILAEKFIKENGYTASPAIKANLSFEGLDTYEDNIDSVLKRRYNTLQSKAFCISEDSTRWHIGFLSTEVNVERIGSKELKSDLRGRAVIVNKKGSEVRIAHKDPLFSKFEKLGY